MKVLQLVSASVKWLLDGKEANFLTVLPPAMR